MEKNKNKVISLGCRLNIYEGEIIKSLTNSKSNLVIINSCAVTNEAEKKVKYEIRKAKRKFPNKKIILTGCAAQINPKEYLSMKEIDYVIGNNEKLKEEIWSKLESSDPLKVKNIFDENYISNSLIEKFEGKARAFVEIQQGCDHRCTYCIIPYGRGNNRSVPVGLIVKRINILVENGYNEIVLTGVDITDYGKDLPGSPNLFQLVKRIFNLIPNLKQLRLSSLDCAEINRDFWEVLNNPRLMPHFHLSLQSGNNLILKRMKRRHTNQQVIDFCKEVRKRRGDVVFGADIIAGFPTETESMFEDSIKMIENCKLTHLHIFPFSPKETTPAAKMPQIKKDIIKKRAKKLRDCGNINMQNYLKSQIGKKTSMLVEKSYSNYSIGKTKYFTKVQINQKLSEGSIVDCKIFKIKNNILHAY